MPASHPSIAAALMLDRKRIDYRSHQAHALKMVQLEPNRLNAGRELVRERIEVDRLVGGLSHATCLKQGLGLLTGHPVSPGEAPYLPAQPTSAQCRT